MAAAPQSQKCASFSRVCPVSPVARHAAAEGNRFCRTGQAGQAGDGDPGKEAELT